MSNNTGVLQVCHVVRNLEDSIMHWVKSFGAGPFYVARFQLPGWTYRGQPAPNDSRVAVGYLGSTNIELSQPMIDGPCLFGDVLRARGEGLHHFWIGCRDMDLALKEYEQAGHPIIAHGAMPTLGRIAYADTMSRYGVYTEIQEYSECVWTMLDGMRAAHESWDGKDPIRDYPAMVPDGTPYRGYAR